MQKLKTLIFIFLFSSCTTLVKENYATPIQLVGDSGGYLILDAKAGEGYLIKTGKGNKKVFGLPYVTKEEMIILAGKEILMQPVDYGESRITITNNSLVNLSPEDQARANAEAIKVNQAVKVTEQTDFNFDFFRRFKITLHLVMARNDSLTAIQDHHIWL